MIQSRNYYNLTLVMILLLQPCHSAKLLTEPKTKRTTDDEDSTRSNFVRFLDLGKGSHISGMWELKQSLQRCGYLTTHNNFTDLFDKDFESAVISFQAKLGFQVTGKLDSETISLIVPRCGVSDALHSLHGTSHFVYFPGKPKWHRASPIKLTYAFSSQHMINYLSTTQIRKVFQSAFSRWAAVIPVSFKETDKYTTANIKIGFYRGDHGDGNPFDGVLGVLGHAFEPEDGRLHLDAAEQWAIDFNRVESEVAVDLESVATHEIGHILGMGHSLLEEAVMYKSLPPRTKKVDLTHDDIQGVQALYGSNRNFNPDSPSGSGGSSYGVSNWIISVTTSSLLTYTVGIL